MTTTRRKPTPTDPPSPAPALSPEEPRSDSFVSVLAGIALEIAAGRAAKGEVA